jgi:DNA repair photolyase
MSPTRKTSAQLTLPCLQAAPHLGEHGGTRYQEWSSRSILNWVDGTRMRDFYSVNPYRGCEFGCLYCYARYTHEFLDRPLPEDFDRVVYVKTNAPEVFARDLKRAARLSSGLHLGSATDPYQPAEAQFLVTRRMLEKLLPHRGIPVSIATKSALVERDADLLAELARRHPLQVVMTGVTFDEALRQELEPRAPPTERRFQALARLSSLGIPTGLLLAPVLPGLNDSEEDLLAMCRRAREAGVGSLIAQVLFLPGASQRSFRPWLARRHPELLGRYARVLEGRREWDEGYRDELRRRIARARTAAGFGPGDEIEVR